MKIDYFGWRSNLLRVNAKASAVSVAKRRGEGARVAAVEGAAVQASDDGGRSSMAKGGASKKSSVNLQLRLLGG